eukprot:g3429.t1
MACGYDAITEGLWHCWLQAADASHGEAHDASDGEIKPKHSRVRSLMFADIGGWELYASIWGLPKWDAFFYQRFLKNTSSTGEFGPRGGMIFNYHPGGRHAAGIFFRGIGNAALGTEAPKIVCGPTAKGSTGAELKRKNATLQEIHRRSMLKPGATVSIHGLTGESIVAGKLMRRPKRSTNTTNNASRSKTACNGRATWCEITAPEYPFALIRAREYNGAVARVARERPAPASSSSPEQATRVYVEPLLSPSTSSGEEMNMNRHGDSVFEYRQLIAVKPENMLFVGDSEEGDEAAADGAGGGGVAGGTKAPTKSTNAGAARQAKTTMSTAPNPIAALIDAFSRSLGGADESDAEDAESEDVEDDSEDDDDDEDASGCGDPFCPECGRYLGDDADDDEESDSDEEDQEVEDAPSDEEDEEDVGDVVDEEPNEDQKELGDDEAARAKSESTKKSSSGSGSSSGEGLSLGDVSIKAVEFSSLGDSKGGKEPQTFPLPTQAEVAASLKFLNQVNVKSGTVFGELFLQTLANQQGTSSSSSSAALLGPMPAGAATASVTASKKGKKKNQKSSQVLYNSKKKTK